MRAIEVLHEEHRWIARMLALLQDLVRRALPVGHLDPAATSELLALFAHFADGLHQQREEEVLFPRLLTRARSTEERLTIGRMAADHEKERRHLQGMHANLLGAIYGEPLSLREFAREAELYVELQRRHMIQETTVLLPLAERLLDRRDDDEMVDSFVRLEGDPQALREVLRRIRELCGRLEASP